MLEKLIDDLVIGIEIVDDNLENEEEIEILDEFEEDEFEEENEIEPLSGVGVEDIENGIKISLVNVQGNVIKDFDIIINMQGYKGQALYELCYNISKKVYLAYYENNGDLNIDKVKEIVRNIIVR